VNELEKKKKKYKNIITVETKIIDALKIMNSSSMNLLVILDGNRFVGLLSIGDIRRAILENLDINNTYINTILRDDILVAKVEDSIDFIKEIMLNEFTVCMPVVDEFNDLKNIYYWDELFLEKKELKEMEVDVVIMAGGKGNRMKPLTNIIPKPLIPIEDKPIIEVIIDNFMRHKVSDFYISVNYKAQMIEDYLKNKESEKCKLSYFIEDKPLGTIGSLFLIKDKLKRTFFVSNCDIIIDDDYADILQYHKENSNDITIVSAVKHISMPYGVLNTKENGVLIDMTEKPEYTFQISTGMYLLEPNILEYIPKNSFFHITDLIAKIQEIGKVGVFPIAEKSWHDIGQWEEYQKTLTNYSLK
jgi:dTDP-glucose pyrophosphorylase